MVFENLVGLWKLIAIVISSFGIYLLLRIFLNMLLKRENSSKTMRHNAKMFVNLITYIFIFVVSVFTVVYFAGDKLSLGITAGLLTAALGWALQRPITGIAAWIMVVVSRPFSIGDRIIIGDRRGDVSNITLSHIYLREFGGTTGGEETSGRIVMVPNSLLFEKDIINYTFQDDFILDEVILTITYESNLDKAKKICLDVANSLTESFHGKTNQKPFLRMSYQPSGIDIKIKYYTPADKRQLFNSMITEETFKKIIKEKDVDLAYPHTEILYKQKKK